MSEAMMIPQMLEGQTKRTPTVYFIDDSATMREVIKIAFRRENINVITCADAASALAQFEQNAPDAVITDVIMPDTDGYAVCTQVKQHPQFGHIPVVLMSGVVNKIVADKAVSVKADELIRKPFQPQELLGRVKALLTPKSATPTAGDRPSVPASHTAGPAALSNLFTPTPTLAQSMTHQGAPPSVPATPAQETAWPRALADAFTPKPFFPPTPAAPSQAAPPHSAPAAASNPSQPFSQPPSAARPASNDILKLRAEIARLELQIKKLQTELQIERQYNQALESQLQALTRSE
jgi:twitching motility two-component system response regulator PilH